MVTDRAVSVCLMCGLLVLTTSAQAPFPASSSDAFVLLHSVVGYERLGAKQALIRAVTSNLDHPASINLTASKAWLVSANGRRRIFPVQYAGRTFGTNWWRVDFSSFRESGAAFQLLVSLKLADAGKTLRLQSSTFEIGDDILFKRTFAGLALENSRARRAPASMGGGYFDCNTGMGEAYSHAMFGAGLLEVLERRGEALNDRQKQELIRAAEIALDYVVQLQQRDGHILDQHPSRPFQGLNPGLLNTTIGAYGLARAAIVLKEVDELKAARYLNAAERAFEYLKLRTVDPGMVVLGALLYRASGVRDYLATAIAHARLDLQRVTPAGEESLEALPYNEGLMALVELAPEHPDWLLWVNHLLDYATVLYDHAPLRNVFHVSPWDNVGLAPEELIAFETSRTSHFSRVAYSTLRLGELFPDYQWEPTTTASLQWVVGLNYGVPGDRVLPVSRDAVVSASFITNLGSRYGKQLTAELQWQQPTIVNGFTEGFRYENTWQASETFILHDGLWLMAISRYGAPPKMGVHTTCGGIACAARVRVNVRGKVVDGRTEESTGRLTTVLPAAGKGTLELFRHGKRIVVPFAARMGAQLKLHVDLEAQLVVSLKRGMPAPDNRIVLKLVNVGYRASRALVRLRAHGAKLNRPTDMFVSLAAGESRAWLIEVAPSSPTYVVSSDVQWNFGHDREFLYGSEGQRCCAR